MQLNEAISSFLEYQKFRKSRTSTTITTYRGVLNKFSLSLENCNVNELTVDKIDEYANLLLVRNYKPKTYRNQLTPVRSLIAYMYKKNLTEIRPEQVDIPATYDQEANFLTEEEQERLIKACVTARERAIILFFLRTGVRVSEFIDAQTDDIHDCSLVVRCGKGRKPRVTFIWEDALRALSVYQRTMPPQKYLFPNASGGKISRQYISRLVSTIAARAKILKKVTCHTLRHTFATNMFVRGARAEEVRPMMGHSNIRTTTIYLHFTNDYLKQRYCNIMAKPITPTFALTQ